jgi:hypothetical protein
MRPPARCLGSIDRALKSLAAAQRQVQALGDRVAFAAFQPIGVIGLGSSASGYDMPGRRSGRLAAAAAIAIHHRRATRRPAAARPRNRSSQRPADAGPARAAPNRSRFLRGNTRSAREAQYLCLSARRPAVAWSSARAQVTPLGHALPRPRAGPSPRYLMRAAHRRLGRLLRADRRHTRSGERSGRHFTDKRRTSIRANQSRFCYGVMLAIRSPHRRQHARRTFRAAAFSSGAAGAVLRRSRAE